MGLLDNAKLVPQLQTEINFKKSISIFILFLDFEANCTFLQFLEHCSLLSI